LIVPTLMALTTFGGSGAAAQASPDFWEVSVRAAAQAGLDSPVSPLILENALSIAEAKDPQGVRVILSKLQLMLSYVWANKLDLYQARFKDDKFSIDSSTFEPELREYLPTLDTLVATFIHRFFHPSERDKEILPGASLYAAQNFTALEVAIRKKIAFDDQPALADALTNEGFIASGRDNSEKYYKEAMDILDEVRRSYNAVAEADQAFSTVKNVSPMPTERNGVFFDELIFTGLSVRSMGDLDDALGRNDQDTVAHILGNLFYADQEQQKIDVPFREAWACYETNAMNSFWTAQLYERDMKASSKSDNDKTSNSRSQESFKKADAAYREALEIELYSSGITENLRSWASQYIDFLNAAGHGDEAKKVQALVATLQKGDIGTGGPKEWRSDVDCEQLSM